MQPNTVNNHHDTTPPVPPELLEAVARALAAALIPPPRRPPPPEPETEEKADFLTAAQLARRLGVSRETVRRLAIAGTLPHTVVCHGARKTTRRYPRRFAEEFAAWRQPTWPPSPPPGGRGSPRPPGDGPAAAAPQPGCPGAFCCALAGAGGVPRHRPGGVLPRARRVRRARAAGLRAVPGPAGVPGLRDHQPHRRWRLGRADRTGTPRASHCLPAGRAS
jgi:excisionase family DNA binding protein